MFKKSKLIAGIALLVQSVAFLIMFFIYLGRRKKTATAFLGVGLFSAISGAFLLIWEKEEEDLQLLNDDWDDCEDLFGDYYDDDIDCVISDDDANTADVLEFNEEQA